MAWGSYGLKTNLNKKPSKNKNKKSKNKKSTKGKK